MLERLKLGSIVIASFVLAAVLIGAAAALGYLAREQDGTTLILVTASASLATIIWGVLLARSITAPLSLIVRMAREIGRRHWGMRLRINRPDEIGLVAHALNQLADDLQGDMVAPLKKVAAGDLTMQVEPRDSQDEIALAVKRIIESLRGLAAETGLLAQSMAEGKLTARGQLGRWEGGYKTILEQVNHALDSVTGPLQIAAQALERQAESNMPSHPVQLGLGDWARLEHGLNAHRDNLRTLTPASFDMVQATAQMLASSDHLAGTEQQWAEAALDVTHAAQVTEPVVEQPVQHAQEMARVISELAAVVEASAQATRQAVKDVEQEPARSDQTSTGVDEIHRTVQFALETARRWQDMARDLAALSEQH